MALGAEQQPLNCVRFRCIGLRDDFADDRGAIIELPGRTAEVSADLPALLIKEIRLGPFERPLKAAFFGFAGVDLDPVGEELEQQCRGLRGRYGCLVSSDGKDTRADQDASSDVVSHVVHARLHSSFHYPSATHLPSFVTCTTFYSKRLARPASRRLRSVPAEPACEYKVSTNRGSA